MNRTTLTIACMAVAAATTLAMADPGNGSGIGMGAGCGAGAGAEAGATCPGGGSPGMGPGHGGGSGMRGGGQGMTLLTPDERALHRENMHSLKSVEECQAYLAQHQQLLQERAKASGVAIPPGPRGNACERMKARGMFG